jgi:hypothetical protein
MPICNMRICCYAPEYCPNIHPLSSPLTSFQEWNYQLCAHNTLKTTGTLMCLLRAKASTLMITGEDLHVTRILRTLVCVLDFCNSTHLLLLWFDMIRHHSKVNYIAEIIDYFKPYYVINYVIIKGEALNTPKLVLSLIS